MSSLLMILASAIDVKNNAAKVTPSPATTKNAWRFTLPRIGSPSEIQGNLTFVQLSELLPTSRVRR
jgi:hypothetical protein